MRWVRMWLNDPVVGWRVWKMEFFPYRTADFLGADENGEMLLGPWKWNRPYRWRRGN